MNPHTIRWVFIITLFVVFLVLTIAWSGVLLPFIIGLVIAYLLDPLIFFVQQKLRMRRLPALGVVFMLFLAFFVLMIISLYPVFALGVTSLSETIGNNKEAIGGFAQGAIDWFEDLSLPIDKDAIKSGLFSKLESFMTQLFGGISSFVLSVIESIPLLILIPLIVFYFLKDKDRIFAVLKRYTRDENELRIRALFESIDVRLGGYIKGQFILSAVVTLITFAGLLIFDIPYAFLIALANGVLNIIPYFGPVIGAIPPVVLALINFSSAGHLIAVIVFFVAMNILVTTLISPKIFATATNLHPLLVLLALFIGGHIMGMMGMIIAIPLAIVVQTLLRAVFDTYIQEI